MFELLEFPSVVLSRIFKKMKSIDLVSLSLISDRAARAVKTCNVKAKCNLIFGKQHPKLVIFGRDNKPIQVIFLFDAEIKEWRGTDEVEKMFNIKSKQLRKKQQTEIFNYKGEKTRASQFGVKRKFQRYHVMRVPPPKLNSSNSVHFKDVPADELLTCTIRRTRSVRFPRLSINDWIRHVLNVLNINSISSVTFKNCNTYLTSKYLNSLVDLPVDSIHPDGETYPFITRMALKSFPSARQLIIDYNRAKEKKGQMRWFQELLSRQFDKITLNIYCLYTALSAYDLIICNSRELTLLGFVIYAEHLNLFLKKWLEGSCPSLMRLEIKFIRKKKNADDFDDILEGIDHEKSESTHNFMMLFSQEYKVGGINIIQRNQTVATLYMCQDTVWDDCRFIMQVNKNRIVPPAVNGPNFILRAFSKKENEEVKRLHKLPSDEYLVIEEGSKYQIGLSYRVQNENIYGLQYRQTICHYNTTIEHWEVFLNGYVSALSHIFTTATKTWSFGMCSRGLYDVHSKITDSAGNILYYKKWTVKII